MRANGFVTRRQFVGAASALAASFFVTGCSGAQTDSSKEEVASETGAEETRTPEGAQAAPSAGGARQAQAAVVFFSQTGNTAAIADHIANYMRADPIRLTAAEPYTDADLDYNDSSTRATVEQNASETRPALAETPDLGAYDTVFLGYPIWWGKAPRVMCTFAEACDLGGKTVVPFCTSGSSGIGGSADELAGLASPDAIWSEGMRFAAGSDASSVEQWIDDLGV